MILYIRSRTAGDPCAYRALGGGDLWTCATCAHTTRVVASRRCPRKESMYTTSYGQSAFLRAIGEPGTLYIQRRDKKRAALSWVPLEVPFSYQPATMKTDRLWMRGGSHPQIMCQLTEDLALGFDVEHNVIQPCPESRRIYVVQPAVSIVSLTPDAKVKHQLSDGSVV